jgi:hypothetical protein
MGKCLLQIGNFFHLKVMKHYVFFLNNIASIPLKGKSAFLVGKDEEIADIYLEN